LTGEELERGRFVEELTKVGVGHCERAYPVHAMIAVINILSFLVNNTKLFLVIDFNISRNSCQN
jgi:hypothetical protein